MSSIKIVFGERLKALRNEKQKTLRELAENLNIPYSTLANYERGEREPSYENLVTIADFFGVTTDYLIGRSDFRTWEEEQLIKENIKSEIVNVEFKETLLALINKYLKLHDIDVVYFNYPYINFLNNFLEYIDFLILKQETILKELNVKMPSTISSVSIFGLKNDKVELFQNLQNKFATDENIKLCKSEILALIEHLQFTFVKYTFDIILSSFEENNKE